MVAPRVDVTPAQIKLHHVLARRMGWADAERRALLRRHFGKASSTQLTQREMSWVLEWQYHQLGILPGPPQWTPGRLTGKQRGYIERFARLKPPSGWHVNPALSRKLLSRLAGRPIRSLDQLTVHEASAVIEALKAIYQRAASGEQKLHGQPSSGGRAADSTRTPSC